jgi:hypothetical protein
MAYDDELLITYGLGYAFEKSKLLIVSEIEEKVVSKNEINIIEEINAVNKFKEEFDTKCNLKFPKNYITNIEEALEEKLSKTIPIITSIKAQNTKKQDQLMDEYVKRDLSQIRLKKEGYIQKDSSLIKKYLDSCAGNLSISMKNKEQKLLRYNKIILKFILTSSFGNEFSNFLSKYGQANNINKSDDFIEKQLEDKIKNNYVIKKKYSELDFLNLLLFLEEWQKKYFIWDEKYTSLMFSINKDGKKYKGKKSEIKDFVISFLKGKRYLYFPFGKYNENSIFTTLSDERYCSACKDEQSTNQSYITLEKKESNLYQIISNSFQEINLENNNQLGYLLSYRNDDVYISLVVYDEKNEKTIFSEEFEAFKSKMIEVLQKHFII